MKSKQKSQVNTRQSYQSLTSNKTQRRTNNKKQQLVNHIPLSSTQHVDLGSRNKLKKYNQDVLGHSPYTSLPSVGNQNVQLRYRESPYQEAQKRVKIKYNHDSRATYKQGNDSTSIYDRLQLGSVNKSVKSQSSSTKQNNPNSLNYQADAKESQIYYNNKFTKVNGNRNVGYFYDPGQGQQQQREEGLGQRQGSIQMNRMKRDISSKLERVCEKVENLSREKCDNEGIRGQAKRNRCDKHNRSGNNNANTINFNNNISKRLDPSINPNLCYSNLVYQPLPQHSPQHPTTSNHYSHQYQLNYQQYQNQQNDNQIMCKVVKSQEESYKRQLEVLEDRVIELNRKVVEGSVRVASLEEQLLAEKQRFITKEKQWLQREHQLLKFIDDNACEQSFSHQSSSPQKPSHHQYSNPPNIILLNHKPLQPLETPDIPTFPNANLRQLLTLTTTLLTKTHHWLNLMNRTPSSQLPGTAFRVKQQMNLNINELQQLRQLCQQIASNNTNYHNNVTNNQSQVFLLQSYCPSQQYEISTNRHLSTHKPCDKSSKKSLLSISESKSTTNNKKAHLTSTHKKSYRKGIGKQNRRDYQQGNYNVRARFQKQVAKSTRRLDYYCHDEVFYVEENGNTVGQQIQVKDKVNMHGEMNLNQQNQLQHHYYQLLTLQAITIESLINQSLPQTQPQLQQQQQQQILL